MRAYTSESVAIGSSASSEPCSVIMGLPILPVSEIRSTARCTEPGRAA